MKKFLLILMTVLLVFTLAFPTFAAVIDETGTLSGEELAYLEECTGWIAREYDIGVYILVVEGYHRYASNGYSDIFDTTAMYYHNNGLGEGPGRDGILLMVDLTYREAAFFVYGPNAEYAMDSHGQYLLEEAFLDDFSENRWYEGLLDFVLTCDELIESAERGEPVRESKAPVFGAIWIAAAVISAVICAVICYGMKSARKQTMAGAYVTAEGLNLQRRDDLFLYRTVTRTPKAESSGGSSGRSHNGHGGSGRSSRF